MVVVVDDGRRRRRRRSALAVFCVAWYRQMLCVIGKFSFSSSQNVAFFFSPYTKAGED